MVWIGFKAHCTDMLASCTDVRAKILVIHRENGRVWVAFWLKQLADLHTDIGPHVEIDLLALSPVVHGWSHSQRHLVLRLASAARRAGRARAEHNMCVCSLLKVFAFDLYSTPRQGMTRRRPHCTPQTITKTNTRTHHQTRMRETPRLSTSSRLPPAARCPSRDPVALRAWRPRHHTS